MTSFRKVPDDILYCVAQELERDLRSLSAISLVCHAFHRASRAVLFRYVDRLSPEKQQQLERSLEEDPKLASYVQSFYLDFSYATVRGKGLELLGMFQKLKELRVARYDVLAPAGNFVQNMRAASLKFKGGRPSDRDFECVFLDGRTFKGIHTIRLSCEFTVTEIIRFMLLPDVRTLSATTLDIMKEPRLPSSFACQKSMITSLDLLGGTLWRMSAETLGAILSFCSRLVALHCQIPMDTEHDSISHQTSRVTQPVCPSLLTTALAPVRETLEELSLLNLRHSVPYDGTFLDLSNFTSLEVLTITSCCLLPPGHPFLGRNELYKLLPASLTCLNLDFPREFGIFYHHEEGEAFLNQDPTNIPVSRYNWIMYLLSHKPTYLPNLLSIKMTDPPGSVGHWRWNTVPWVPPPEVVTLREETGVSLSVEFSCPQPGSNMDTWHAQRFKSRDKMDSWSYKY